VEDLIVGVGLALVIEGVLYAAAPDAMRRAVAAVLSQPASVVRGAGLALAALGVAVVWLVRG